MISEQDVKHIAKLARFQLTKKETVKIQKELSSILDYFNLLQKADFKQSSLIQPKNGLTKNETREDFAIKQSTKTVNRLLESAPKKEKGYIKVKTILR